MNRTRKELQDMREQKDGILKKKKLQKCVGHGLKQVISSDYIKGLKVGSKTYSGRRYKLVCGCSKFVPGKK